MGGSSDPRLSSELRKTGLSEEALLRRGGGRRISIGPKQMDSNENAVALDIISTLNCDALQEELERDWHTVLDEKRLAAENDRKWNQDYGGDKDWGAAEDYQGGAADDFAGELAGEVGFGSDAAADAADMGGDAGFDFNGAADGNEKLDDFVNRRRRLLGEDDMVRMDDAGFGGGGSYTSQNQGLKLTARHLFCLAAEALTLPKSTSENIPDPSTHCDIKSLETRDELLYLWSSARSQMQEDVIQKTLRLVTEHKETLRGNEVHIWYPDNDKGTEGMLNVLNSGYEGRQSYNFDTEPAETSHDNLYRFHDLPSKFVGSNKLFVDVGSALGLTPMLIAYLYPETTVVSIEPASPSWLIQNINYRCNLSHNQLQYIHPILAGVGTRHHDDNDSMMKMVWRPSMTTATRSWNPEQDFDFAVDIELVVHLRTLRAILAEATPEDLPLGTPISVLNLDCEGCEYNLIPSMHETSFNSIGVILGRTNWGYIPTIKKPSSHRARETHERVCTHYNFAKRCKECCDFLSLAVKPRVHNTSTDSEVESSGETTVAEVAGELCNGFEEWAKESKLRDIPDDYGWNEMSAFASN
eukprot:CAMPEP_0172323482 /NCGR_PEP_ID=MMETSP1058-20130122/48840_1 /TAXON_ID=83371 /ORGANISM="Detonula confervacea, Strain CCMP 353" /LENGTH=582 /DNA_ID=CAMNT_0013039489 /DNA_START=301 /DNA_END=2049 /DNA_ORIENTATION=-